MFLRREIFLCVFVFFQSSFQRTFITTDDLENNISPEDLEEFFDAVSDVTTTTEAGHNDSDPSVGLEVPNNVNCFGLSPSMRRILFYNMKPDSTETVNTQFYFVSRKQPYRYQMFAGDQFGLEAVDFKPERKTVMIVHGFMSDSNVQWINDMAQAFLNWADVNVMIVDWSGGGNTWVYFRAVANTRRVGSDITDFLRQLMSASGANPKDFHFVGHSLGAHICSYVSFHIGGVARITGLDPALPCFDKANSTERLDETDADFVDVIHTNGRLLGTIGFGLPEPIGHADFYPNGGMVQPGCFNESKSMLPKSINSVISQFQEAVCSHGRAYLLFTESLNNNNCSFRAYHWDLTYEGVNTSIRATCDRRRGSCSEMGIKAIGMDGLPRAQGAYFTLTTEKKPYCPTEFQRQNPMPELRGLRSGLSLDPSIENITTTTAAPADPDGETDQVPTTTPRSWLGRVGDTLTSWTNRIFRKS